MDKEEEIWYSEEQMRDAMLFASIQQSNTTDIDNYLKSISQPKQEPVKWDGFCRCGHTHSKHRKLNAYNPNITAAKCLISGCECKYFCQPPESLKPEGGRE